MSVQWSGENSNFSLFALFRNEISTSKSEVEANISSGESLNAIV